MKPFAYSDTPSALSRRPLLCGAHDAVAFPMHMDQTSMCLRHYSGSSGGSGVEHEPPRTFDNEMTAEEIEDQAEVIHNMYIISRWGTTAIHKSLETPTKRLGERGKQKVSG